MVLKRPHRKNPEEDWHDYDVKVDVSVNSAHVATIGWAQPTNDIEKGLVLAHLRREVKRLSTPKAETICREIEAEWQRVEEEKEKKVQESQRERDELKREPFLFFEALHSSRWHQEELRSYENKSTDELIVLEGLVLSCEPRKRHHNKKKALEWLRKLRRLKEAQSEFKG